MSDLLSRALEMRNALDAIELSLMGLGNLVDLPELYENQRLDLRLSIGCTVEEMRRTCQALSECTRIVNSDEFTPSALLNKVGNGDDSQEHGP